MRPTSTAPEARVPPPAPQARERSPAERALEQALDELVAATTDAERRAAKARIDRLREELRRARRVDVIRCSVRPTGLRIARACLDNPLAKECGL